MRRLVLTLAFVLLLLVSAGLGTAGGVSTVGDAHTRPAPSLAGTTAAIDGPAGQVSGTFERSRVIITVYENRSARWTFRYERTLANQTEVDDFESFSRAFESQETQLYADFKRDARALVGQGANVTGREMSATDFGRQAFVTTSLGNDLGVVTMSFTWTEFAQTAGDRYIVGDVFEGGLYIGNRQSLVVRPGPNLAFSSVAPAGTQSNTSSLSASDSVTWQGEKEFTDNRPRVVFVPETTQVVTTGSGGSPTTPTTGPDTSASPKVTETPNPGRGNSWILASLGVLALLGGVAGVLWYRRRDAGGADEVTTAPGDDAPPAQPSVTQEELMSDEDRVIALLNEHGGRMRQVKIVQETNWSKSKVSMLLSEMEDQDKISKIRVGRENVIALYGHEPDAAKSPFDEDE